MSTANEKQVNGNHYKKSKIQHWDFVIANGLDYFQGQITKYVTRWRFKNGVADLEKGLHFTDKYLEVIYNYRFLHSRDFTNTCSYGSKYIISIADYKEANGLTELEAGIIDKVCTCTEDSLYIAKLEIQSLMHSEPGSNYVDQDK